jgi:hypothetical protein
VSVCACFTICSPWPPTSSGVVAPADIVVRLIKHRCRLLQRGVMPEPFDVRDVFPRRSLWAQCEAWLPPARGSLHAEL